MSVARDETVTGRSLWQAFWGQFAKKDPKGMSKPLKRYWNQEAERRNAGEAPLSLAIFTGDPELKALEHGFHRVSEGNRVWNEEGYLPPDPNHKKKGNL